MQKSQGIKRRYKLPQPMLEGNLSDCALTASRSHYHCSQPQASQRLAEKPA